jgi:hypothetical protein
LRCGQAARLHEEIMKRAALKIAPGRVDHLDRDAMSAALTGLHQAASQSAADMVAALSASERARLAVFCYGRVHLNTIGLAIAATCELDHLIAASGSAAAGRALFARSRETAKPAGKQGRRAITLATSGRFAG